MNQEECCPSDVLKTEWLSLFNAEVCNKSENDSDSNISLTSTHAVLILSVTVFLIIRQYIVLNAMYFIALSTMYCNAMYFLEVHSINEYMKYSEYMAYYTMYFLEVRSIVSHVHGYCTH